MFLVGIASHPAHRASARTTLEIIQRGFAAVEESDNSSATQRIIKAPPPPPPPLRFTATAERSTVDRIDVVHAPPSSHASRSN